MGQFFFGLTAFTFNLHKSYPINLSPQNKNYIVLPFLANIWKIDLNIENFLLIVELRDDESRQTSFAGIDIKKGRILWIQNQLPEKWWIGLSETKGNFVLLHGYMNIQTPVHLKTFVLNVQNGELLWKNESLKPVGFNDDNLIVCKEEQSDDYLVINPSSGETINTLSGPFFKKEAQTSPIVNPDYYSADNKYFERIADFIHYVSGMMPEIAVEYLEHKGKIISSFYVRKAEKLVNYILLADEGGEVLWQEEIGKELNAAAADAFFLIKDQLVYIKNKKELVIFEL